MTSCAHNSSARKVRAGARNLSRSLQFPFGRILSVHFKYLVYTKTLMMSRNYKFHNPDGIYFVSFAVIEWLYVFTDNTYKDILLDNLAFYQKQSGMEIFAWCIMTNHVHLVFRCVGEHKPAQVLGNFKRFTSKAIVKAITENPQESRKKFLLQRFRLSAEKATNVSNYQFWRHDNKPIELWSNKVIDQKIDYIHNNPVSAGIVFHPEDYRYSSAIDYAGGKGLLGDIIVVY
jgi:REP element-mobilizing transposase RayT